MKQLIEMANRRKKQTGLPVNVWIDENGSYLDSGHAKKIKVQLNYGEKMQHQPFCSMTLDGKIVGSTFDKSLCEVSTKDLRKVSNYVVNNSYALDKVADEEIYMEDFDEISIKGGDLASEEEIARLIYNVNRLCK